MKPSIKVDTLGEIDIYLDPNGKFRAEVEGRARTSETLAGLKKNITATVNGHVAFPEPLEVMRLPHSLDYESSVSLFSNRYRILGYDIIKGRAVAQRMNAGGDWESYPFDLGGYEYDQAVLERIKGYQEQYGSLKASYDAFIKEAKARLERIDPEFLLAYAKIARAEAKEAEG